MKRFGAPTVGAKWVLASAGQHPRWARSRCEPVTADEQAQVEEAGSWEVVAVI